jgi:hypothetical protein
VFGLGQLGRRAVESVVSLFAILGFVYVPLGRHTGYEHAKAVLATPAAAEAMRDLTAAALSLRQRALDLVTGTPEPQSANPAEIKGPGAVSPTHGPRAVPPKLR